MRGKLTKSLGGRVALFLAVEMLAFLVGARLAHSELRFFPGGIPIDPPEEPMPAWFGPVVFIVVVLLLGLGSERRRLMQSSTMPPASLPKAFEP